MNILYLLVPIAIILAGVAVWGFVWAVRNGQFDDTQTPAMRMLWDDQATNHSTSNHKTKGVKS